MKRWVQYRYPRQIYQSAYGPLLFFTPVVTIALAIMKMLPPDPWHMGGGLSDFIAVSGQEDYMRCIEGGVSVSKIVITGEPNHDILHKSWQSKVQLLAALHKKYGLNPEQKLIVCALPQLAEARLLDWDAHWKEIRFLAATLAQSGANVCLSLHPKSDLRKYQFLENEYNVRILQEPLRDVLPAADVFVATYSSTVRWAVLLGIPSVVVDFYNFNLSLYDHYEGIVKVTQKTVFASVLRAILHDHSYYERLQKGQHKYSLSIAPFDGQAGKRMIDLISRSTLGNQ